MGDSSSGVGGSAKRGATTSPVEKARAKVKAAKSEGRTTPRQACSSFSFFSEAALRAAQINFAGAQEGAEEPEPQSGHPVKTESKVVAGKGSTRLQPQEKERAHPFRQEAPSRIAYARGSEANLDRVQEDEVVVEEIRAEELAKTTVPTAEARWAWWKRRCKARGWQPLDLTPRRLEVAAALLRKGKYRSGPAYLSEIKKRYVEAGGGWSLQLGARLRSLNRALNRGLGPPRKADEFPIEAAVEIPESRLEAARTPTWPTACMPTMIACCAWLLRELESSSASLSDVTLHEPEGLRGCGWAEWVLPACKTDTAANGITRSLSCACPSKLCPVAALRAVATASELVRQIRTPDRSREAHPLVCKPCGAPMSKTEVVKFYGDITKLTDLQGARITGHSCRVTGAKRMALAGHPIWTIQVFGRWGSKAILGYVREALLGHQGGNLAHVTEQAAANRVSLKSLKRLAEDSISIVHKTGRLSVAARRTMVDMVLEHMTELWQSSGPSTIEDLEPDVLLKANEVCTFAEEELKAGTAKGIRSARGRLHVRFNGESCMCGWIWAGQKIELVKRCKPRAGETAGWCRRCHAWTIELVAAS